MKEPVAPDHDDGGTCADLDMPWARSPPARVAREMILRGGLHALLTYYTRRRTTGVGELAELEPPVLFVANHCSHIDTPLILCALPGRWRRRTAVAAAVDYFYADRRVAALASLAFNTVPVRRRGGGTRDVAHVEALLADRWSLLLYPQGTRSQEGCAQPLRSGAAVLAARHGLPIVPVRVGGTRAAMPPGQSWPRRRSWRRRHPTTVTFGAVIDPRSVDERAEVMARLRAFFAGGEPAPSRPEGLASAQRAARTRTGRPTPGTFPTGASDRRAPAPRTSGPRPASRA